jgi:hypothetical protein
VLQELRHFAKIVNQFAITTVTSQATNPSPMPQEASISFLIPDNALISNLTMTIDDVFYVAKPQNKATAQTAFLSAKDDNCSAILLSVDKVSGQNEVKILTHLQSFQTVTFNFTYEEYIFKKNGTYRHSLKIASEVYVELVESVFFIQQPPSIRIAQITTANHACQEIILGRKQTKAKATIKSSTHCPLLNIGPDLRIHLDLSLQYTLTDNGTHDLVTDESYFAHFLIPESLTIFKKHVVFIIDVSMDLGGKQYQQMQDTLKTIINSLTDVDTFQLITFNNRVTNTWPNLNTSLGGTESNKQNAIAFVRRLNVGRGGNKIITMLLAAIVAASHGSREPNTKKMIFFLTDRSSITATEKLTILKNDWRANYPNRIPIHGLAFGNNPDLKIIEMVTQRNHGKAIRLE